MNPRILRALVMTLMATIAAGICLPLAAQLTEPRLIKIIDTKKDLPQLAAWAPDGIHLAYGTERELLSRAARRGVEDAPRAYPAEVWLWRLDEPDKKPKRLLDYREVRALNYRIDRLSWSPDGKLLAAEMTHRRLGTATFFFNQKGKKARLGGHKRFNFVMGYGGGWMGDSLNYGLLVEAEKPRLLHQVELLRVEGGRVLERFRHDFFTAVAWLPNRKKIAGIKRDRDFEEPPLLVLGDLDKSTLEELGEVDDYQGRLAALPDEKHISYFTAYDTLTVRSIESGEITATLPAPMGAYQWSPAGDAVYYLEPEEIGDTTGRLTRVDLESGEKTEILGAVLHDFWFSPDASHVAVLTARGTQKLKIYRLR